MFIELDIWDLEKKQYVQAIIHLNEIRILSICGKEICEHGLKKDHAIIMTNNGALVPRETYQQVKRLLPITRETN